MNSLLRLMFNFGEVVCEKLNPKGELKMKKYIVLTALTAVSLATLGCASRGSVQELQERMDKVESNMLMQEKQLSSLTEGLAGTTRAMGISLEKMAEGTSHLVISLQSLQEMLEESASDFKALDQE